MTFSLLREINHGSLTGTMYTPHLSVAADHIQILYRAISLKMRIKNVVTMMSYITHVSNF